MINESKTSLERRLYAAWHAGKGIRMSVMDVVDLVADDAIQCRIANAIAAELGYDEPGNSPPELFAENGSIAKFKRQLQENLK